PTRIIERSLPGFNVGATPGPCPSGQARARLEIAFKSIERAAMNRRHFGLSVAAAALLAQQLREAVAQGPGQPPSSVDTDSAWRMRDAATALLESLDDAGRRAAFSPLAAAPRTSL